MDGATDGGAAWAGVRRCPTPSAGEFVHASPSGATGPDDSIELPTSDPNEFLDPLRYEDTINADWVPGHVDCYFYSAGWHRLVSRGSYTDGSWHLVQCAKGATGMTLDIDGRLVASNTFTGPTLAYSGYWLIGYRRAGDGPRQSIIGDVGQVAVYGYAPSQAQDANHYAVAQGQPSTGA